MTLPEGWVATTIESLAAHEQRSITDGPFGSALKSDHYTDLGIRVIRLNNIGPGNFIDDDAAFISLERFQELQAHEAKEGDFVTAALGEPLGRTCIIPNKVGTAIVKADCFRTRVHPDIDKKYILAVINSPNVRKSFAERGRGIGRVRINLQVYRSTIVPVAPVAEQRRIVAKLDALTARLARTRRELERVVTLRTKLRQSILARAFSGELTAAWRKQEGSADVDWQTCPLSEIADVQGGIQVGKKRPADAVLVEVPYLRVANVQRGWLRLDEIKTLAVTAEERDRLVLKDGDILMNEGGDRDKLGRGWVWRDQVPGCIHQNHVFRVRLKDPDFPPEFVSHYANEFGQPYFIDQGTQTTNLASISKRRVMALPVPVPPVSEAKEIVRLITNAFARADRVEAEAARARALLDRLEGAILAKAFRGELVPQDPNDEPASVLLDRIRAERAATPKPKRGRARKAVG